MKFRELYIQNVGVFETFKISFPKKKDSTKAEIHIFTGINGSGKSTILYALAGMFENSELLFKRFRNGNTEPYVETRIDETLIGVFQIINNEIKSNYFSFLDSHQSLISVFKFGNRANYVSNIIFASNPIMNKPINYLINKINYNPSLRNINFDFAVFSYSGYRSITNYKMDAIKELTVSPFEDSLSFLKSVNIDILIQWIANTKTKLALAKSEENAGKEAEKYAKSLENIESIVKEITGIEVKFTLLREPLAVAINYDGKDIALDLLPDGLKSIISWVADLLMRMDRIPWVDDRNIFDREFILFLDEIEVHLHPKWQRKILPVIQKFFKNAQIFIATHSPFVVGSVEGATIHKLDVVEGKSVLVGTEDSKAGYSIELILEDVFGVKEEGFHV